MKIQKIVSVWGDIRYIAEESGLFHREDGSAIIWADGSEFWYLNGVCHREDGPAAIYRNYKYTGDLYQVWFIDGKKLDCNTQEEFEQWMKLKAFW